MFNLEQKKKNLKAALDLLNEYTKQLGNKQLATKKTSSSWWILSSIWVSLSNHISTQAHSTNCAWYAMKERAPTEWLIIDIFLIFKCIPFSLDIWYAIYEAQQQILSNILNPQVSSSFSSILSIVVYIYF